jgi:putative glutathione S-transferase
MAATAQFTSETSSRGAWVRQANRFTDRITADGSSGYPAETGRYHLYVCYACPWAHRSIIVRRLLGLEDVLGMTAVDPIRHERGWRFTLEPDPVNDFEFLSQAYEATDPTFEGRYTVPALWDTATGRLVSNDYPAFTTMMETEFAAFHRPGAPDLYPEPLRDEMDALAAEIFTDVNNGVYKAGFATSQEAYDDAVHALFARLDELEERLSTRRYLLGDAITDVDVRLYTTLARFDLVYVGHFKCNIRCLREYPALWGYARDLWQTPGFGDTTDFDQIRRHYHCTHGQINPSRILPAGPDLDWAAPHGRERLAG